MQKWSKDVHGAHATAMQGNPKAQATGFFLIQFGPDTPMSCTILISWYINPKALASHRAYLMDVRWGFSFLIWDLKESQLSQWQQNMQLSWWQSFVFSCVVLHTATDFCKSWNSLTISCNSLSELATVTKVLSQRSIENTVDNGGLKPWFHHVACGTMAPYGPGCHTSSLLIVPEDPYSNQYSSVEVPDAAVRFHKDEQQLCWLVVTVTLHKPAVDVAYVSWHTAVALVIFFFFFCRLV